MSRMQLQIDLPRLGQNASRTRHTSPTWVRASAVPKMQVAGQYGESETSWRKVCVWTGDGGIAYDFPIGYRSHQFASIRAANSYSPSVHLWRDELSQCGHFFRVPVAVHSCMVCSSVNEITMPDEDSPFIKYGHTAIEPKHGAGSRTIYILFCNDCLQLRYAPGPMLCGKCQVNYEVLKVYQTKAPRV